MPTGKFWRFVGTCWYGRGFGRQGKFLLKVFPTASTAPKASGFFDPPSKEAGLEASCNE